ncbi:unnamed protein product [Paramecium sonneborni]|uniref:Protein kinase domain-containing protein n=1 Tax=Paramecium sonneborni TaxID=65129 RepID=A0A8S1QTW6_9CILI|nr:unnamed protein product [Paramecium sonneborni]
MSNLTFSGMRTLKVRVDEEDQNKKRHPFDLQKYQHILEQISTTHQFDIDLENRLNQLDQTEQSRPTLDKSSFLNKQYAKYIEKGSDLQLSKVDCIDPEEDVCTHKQTKSLLNFIKGRPVKFTEFYKILLQEYSIEFQNAEQKLQFKENLKNKIVTVDPNIVSLNALQLCTRDKGIKGLIEEIAEETYQDINRKEKQKINNEIVDELENVKQLLEKKQVQQIKKEKELVEYEYSLQKFKSEMSNSIQQVYEILSKMMEEQYQSKLSNLNKKFNNLEHQLKSKVKIIELKGSSIQKNNSAYGQEIQKLKQRNGLLEKQVESQKVRILELEKKLSLEKDNTIQLQKKLEKVNQKLVEQKEQIKEQIYNTEQNESLQSLKQQQQQAIEQSKQCQTQQLQQGDQQKKTSNNQDNQMKLVKVFQSVFEQIFIGLDQLQIQLGIENKKWNQELLPCCLQDNLIDLLGNLMLIVINKQGFQQIYKLLLQLSYFYFKNTCTTINCQQIEEVIKNQKKQQNCKYYIGIHDSKNREFILQLKALLEKKKKNQTLVAFILLLYDRDISISIKYLSQEICNEDVQKFILDNGLLDVFVIKMIDDRNMVQLLLEIIAQGQFQNQFLQQLTKHFDILLTMLNSQDLEFCEQLSIVLQRVQYYNKQTIQNNFRGLIEKKMNYVNNVAYGQGYLLNTKNEQLIQINKTYDSFVQYEQARTETQKRTQIQDPTICRLMKFTTSEQKSFCGQLFGIQLQYQYTQKCVGELKKLSQFDCLSIIKDVTQALLMFISKRIRHGQLSPQTILITQNNRYQLTDIRFITDIYEYKMQLIGFTNQCYLAPILVYELGKRTLNPIYNYEKSEVFSLGLVILELALQQSAQSIYDLSKFLVSQDVINTYLRVLSQQYQPQFVDLLGKMLQVDEEQRIDLYQLEKILNQKMNLSTNSLGNRAQMDKFVNSTTMNNKYQSQSPSPSQGYVNKQHTYQIQNSYNTNNYSTTHQERNQQEQTTPQNQMTFYVPQRQQQNTQSNYHSKTPTQLNSTQIYERSRKQSPETVDSYRFTDNRRIKTEFDYQISNNIHQHSSNSFISPERKQDNQLDHLFNQFGEKLQKVKQKINHLRINTPTSQTQSYFNQSYHSQFAESVDEFPTFKPDALPDKIDVGMDQSYFQREFQNLYSKNYNFKVLERPNYYPNSFYDDMLGDASLPTSGTIHMHSSGPATLNDFFLKKK